MGQLLSVWWLANAVQSLVPVSVFAGSPIMIWYCRLMGRSASGKDCYIGTQPYFLL